MKENMATAVNLSEGMMLINSPPSHHSAEKAIEKSNVKRYSKTSKKKFLTGIYVIVCKENQNIIIFLDQKPTT